MTWFDILKGGSLRLHFPSFKRAVLEWNETQQVGNKDRLENMLKEIQPIYERNYFGVIGNKRRVTMNANKKVPMAKQALSNILHNNGWQLNLVKDNVRITEPFYESGSQDTSDNRFSGGSTIGSFPKEIRLYEKVK